MLMSVRWMNDYLHPPPEEEQGELLTAAGFPSRNAMCTVKTRWTSK